MHWGQHEFELCLENCSVTYIDMKFFPLFWFGALAPEVCPIIFVARYRTCPRTNRFLGNISTATKRKEYTKKNLFVESIYMTMFLHNATLNFELYGCSLPPYKSELSVPIRRLPFAPRFLKMIFKTRRSSLWGWLHSGVKLLHNKLTHKYWTW